MNRNYASILKRNIFYGVVHISQSLLCLYKVYPSKKVCTCFVCFCCKLTVVERCRLLKEFLLHPLSIFYEKLQGLSKLREALNRVWWSLDIGFTRQRRSVRRITLTNLDLSCV